MLNTLELYPDEVGSATKILFANFGQAEAIASLSIIKSLRNAGISAEIYPEASKMKKQIGYANSLGIPFFAMIGESELQQGVVSVKDMTSGEQTLLKPEELLHKLLSK